MNTGFAVDELCFWHDPGNYALMLKPGGFVEPYNRHIENADPKRRLHNLLRVSGMLDNMLPIAARDAQIEELLRVHTREHVQHVVDVSAAGGGELGVGTPISSNGWDCARRSAGLALAAVDAVMSAQVQRAYGPDLIVVACGYDAGRLDPLGRMLLDGKTFRWMTQAVMHVADTHAQGRLVLTHEGGYCPVSAPFFGLAVLETLTGERTDVQCPITAHHDKVSGHALQPHQRVLITSLAEHFEQQRQMHWR